MGRAGRHALVLVGLLGGFAAAWAQDGPRPRSLPAAVVRVVSGDSINVFVNGEVERVRYIGVTSPEPGESVEGGDPQGRAALQFNRGLVNLKNVRLELDAQERDPDGRLLAYVWIGDVMANAEVIGRGYGQVVGGGPNVRYQDLLLRRQQEARASRLGIWKSAGPPPPSRR
ncbi:MAG TPA: thermonuclease family protein [Candidatus Nitrosotalea sp.]|nr:thermonuclease family protein [Candidatus Nitrosotalea sp.]